MTKLSVAIATFNEEKNIGKCLQSIKDVASEIIVVDGGSSDETIEISKKYNARIIHTDNPEIFHINKQKAIDACTGDIILQLDADEVVSEGLVEELKSILNKSSDDIADGYWVSRKNFFLGRFLMKGGQFPDYTLRLYKKGKGRLPQKSVHEQAEVDGTIEYLKNSLLHYPYSNFSVYLSKWRRYNLLQAKELRDELKNKNSLMQMLYAIGYLLIKPVHWFLITYIRHKGILDGWQGFVFSFFSALRFPASYIIYLLRK